MKLRDHMNLKTEGAEFFGKIPVCAKAGQKGPKWSDLSVRPLWKNFFSGLLAH